MKPEDQGIQASADRYRVIPRTLCFVTHGQDVLLLKGAPDKRLWANRYNGVGGHIERGETVYAAAQREICEETGWCADEIEGLTLRGIIHIDAGDPHTGIMLFVFTARARERETHPSSEGALEWVPRSRLNEYDLVQDLPTLLPRLLSMPDDAEPFFARYSYDSAGQWHIHFSPYHLPDMW